ncbi:autophagy-related protein 13a-like isoform X2 [Aristolochia californica]|uniref:autophagy-related protein 13a-like isoform X2 n=1 Tax=Aristolochia californica TaxID=171875 RepID=UPI0035DCD6ED
MALQGNPHSECTRTEQIISQFLLKSLHIILDSRIPSFHSNDHQGDPGSARKRDKWFNLALGDPPAALENLNFWHRNVADPMIIDVILIHEAVCSLDLYTSSRALKETVVERWVLRYEPLRTASPSGEGSAAYKKMYKKSIILLRSLYSTLKLLPVFRAFRLLSSSSQTYNFDLSYKVSSFSEPFNRAEEEYMKLYDFVPVETPFGRVSLSVTYRSSLSDLNLEPSSSLPPQIITDYVGSPAAEPIKVFPSSEKGPHSTSFTLKSFRSPSSSPFQRPHSWSSGLYRPGPTIHQTYGCSPPLSDVQNSPPHPYGQKIPHYRPVNHKKGLSFDEHRLSPPFSPSPSPSPSPPTYFSGSNNPIHSRLRESAPVSIPLPLSGKNHRYLTPNSSDPNKHSLPPPSPRSLKADYSSGSPSENRSFRKLDGLRGGDSPSGSANLHGYAVHKDSRDDSGRFSGVVSSSGSPRVGFSRSSSRLSFQDDLDDCEFPCPFAVDDVDSSDSHSRTTSGREAAESTSTQAFTSPRTSQDAAVGILVHMLRTAPPLRQDHSYLSQSSKSELDGQVGQSGFFLSRKTLDAMEELRSYREMKEMLLSQSGGSLLGSIKDKTK